MGIKLDKVPSALDQNNYGSQIANVYIDYNLDPWPKNPTKNFKFKSCLFGETGVIKKGMCISAMEWHLVVQVHGVLIMTLLEIYNSF